MRQALLQGHRRQLGNGLQQRHGDVHAHDRSGLQETLGLRRQAVDARGQHRLHGGWELEVRQGGPGAGRLVRRRALPRVLLHQCLRQLLQEEGIALRLGEEHLGERGRDGLALEHRLDDLHTVLGRERWHGELGGIGLLQPHRPVTLQALLRWFLHFGLRSDRVTRFQSPSFLGRPPPPHS